MKQIITGLLTPEKIAIAQPRNEFDKIKQKNIFYFSIKV